MPHGNIDLGQHRPRECFFAWWHQAITWTNVDLSSVRFSDNHLRAISQEIPQSSITEISLKITYLDFNSNLPGVNELCTLSMLCCVLFCFDTSRCYNFWFNSLVLEKIYNCPLPMKQPWRIWVSESQESESWWYHYSKTKHIGYRWVSARKT